jgi:aminoglycoside phosphotransferase (APT) family kinase protein
MTGGIPAADVDIDVPLVRALLNEQHPDLASLPLFDVETGWDNVVYRLGDDRAVRLPRRAAAAALIGHEQRWLPELAPRLPLPVPTPVRTGQPGCGYPWSWTIARWLAGQSAAVTPSHDPLTVAAQLGAFLHALHQPAPPDAPRNLVRGVPLLDRTQAVHDRASQVTSLVDSAAVLDLWKHLVQAVPWPGPPLWIHGDFHPGNVLISKGHASAVIDFGDVRAGDPATDLAMAWMMFQPSVPRRFRTAAGGSTNWIDDDTWTRARAWALVFGLAFLAILRDSEVFGRLGRSTLEAVLGDDSR